MSDDNIKPIEPPTSVPEVSRDYSSPQPQPPPEDAHSLLYASVMEYLKQTFTTALFGQDTTKPRAHKDISVALAALHTLLLTLKTTDQTDNPHFAQELSDNWHILLSIPRGSPLDPFIDLANDYPHGDPHSLGFYLTHHTGDHWLPFPFLDILKKLHQGYLLRKKRSELVHMLTLLEHASAHFAPM